MNENFCGVTLSAINFISGATYMYNGSLVKLKNDNGAPNIKACMYALGFDPKYGETYVEIEEKGQPVTNVMLVRNVDRPYECEYERVITGKMRLEYNPPEELGAWLSKVSFSEGLMHVAKNGKGCHPVNKFGNNYNGSVCK